ncbi:MAG TPA: vWA domain-containing protein, partial [Hyphomicrobium sp.]|nr:vWA domain-containing protein [Hyphomicrobium sp.]
FGIAAFSTAPMVVLPLTDHKEILFAAIDAMDRPGLAFTDIGRGLAMALNMQERDPSYASRAIVLVSDGAAVIGRRLQERLRTEFARQPVSLYWLFLRTEGTRGIFDVPASGEEDTPQVLPERHLNKFFASLRIPYKAFEAENPEAVATAIEEISKLERMPIAYPERVPQKDLSHLSYAIAFLALLLLLLAKLAERNIAASGARYANS